MSVYFAVISVDGDILAKFEAPSRQFLFPAPSFKPRDGINRDLLLTRTSHFPVEKVMLYGFNLIL